MHVLQQRETDSSACNYKNFPAKNYFNAAMMMKMEIRRTLSLGGHNFDDAVKHLSWNCAGEVLACGQPNRGVKLVRPFAKEAVASGATLEEDEFVADAVFMPRFENSLVVGTRKYSLNLLASSFTEVNFTSRVKVWDVRKAMVTMNYEFDGLLQQVVTCPALPNNLWFNLDSAAVNIAEADVRTKSYASLKLTSRFAHRELTFKNCFDVDPVDGGTMAVGGRNKVCYYDRRMLTPDPYKVVDLRPLRGMDLVVAKLKYHPNGRKILMTLSLGFQHLMADVSEASTDNMRSFRFRDPAMLGTILRNPSFLGGEGRYVMFDTFFKDFVVVFDSWDFKYLGKIKLQVGSNSGTESCPHPHCCVIALAHQGLVHFVSPTSSASSSQV